MSHKGGKMSQMESVRLKINEHMLSVGEEIVCVLEKRADVCSLMKLNVRVVVLERVSAAAQFMCNLFQREMETLVSLLVETQNRLQLLDIDSDVDVHHNSADVSSDHEEKSSPSQTQEEPQPPQHEERSPSPLQEEPQQPPQIKQEQEEEADVSTWTGHYYMGGVGASLPDSHDEADEDTAGGRKRMAEGKKIVQKRRRMMGQSYVGKSKGEKVNNGGRVMGPRCQSAACARSSKFHCNNIAEADREAIFKCFWENMNWEEKRKYVQGLIDVTPVKRRRGSTPQRAAARVFFLNVHGQRRRVCRSLFMSTLGIKAWTAFHWKPTTDTENAQKNAASKGKGEAHEFMRDFLRDLPKVPSASSTSKQYLEPGFRSISDLHKAYQRAAEEKMLRPFSRQVFSEEFQRHNLGLCRPKKDQGNGDTGCSSRPGNLSDNELQDHPLDPFRPKADSES